jgi:hypothetical protein
MSAAEDYGALKGDVAKYFQIAVSGAIEQAFTAPLEAIERPNHSKTISDEIAEQVRAALVHSVRTTFKDNFQAALDKEVKGLIAHGFGIKPDELPQHNFFATASQHIERKEEAVHAAPAPKQVKTEHKPQPIVAASSSSAPKASASKDVGKSSVPKKKPAPLRDVEDIKPSSLALRSPITPKIDIPAHIAEPTQKIVTTPLSYDAHKQTWTEEENEGGARSAPADFAKPLKIPQKLALDVNAGTTQDSITTTPIAYKEIGGDFEPIEITVEEEKEKKAAAVKAAPKVSQPQILPGSVLPANTNPDSKRNQWRMQRGISLDTNAFFGEEKIATTPVGTKGEELEPAKNNTEDGYEDDDESEKNKNDLQPQLELKRPIPKRKQSLRGMAFKNANDKRQSMTGAMAPSNSRTSAPPTISSAAENHADVPKECETPTSRTKRNLRDAKFGFVGGSEEKSQVSFDQPSVSFEQPAQSSDAPVLKKKPKEKQSNSMLKQLQLKATLGVEEPHSAGAVESSTAKKQPEFGMECPSPTSKRGRLTRSATVGGIGSAKTMPAMNRPSMTIVAEDNVAMQECSTPHSRELANSKFEFPKPKAASAPALANSVLTNLSEAPLETVIEPMN